ncbi:hypothetical protein [Candidatus Ichthyocystis sparus]|uniref:hypothetical protein n=1 Tax=Candidatus Ichthyocystis sparus TaxID=1561004 RepID=UPI00159EBFB9|nr:hypothetical protein [Candidatus Ichthyocystis sparus]
MYPVSATGGAASSGVPESEDSGDNNKGEEVSQHSNNKCSAIATINSYSITA